MRNDRLNTPQTSAERAISRFRRKIALLLTFKHSIGFITIWCFVWGISALILRAAAGAPRRPLLWGAVGCLFAVIAAALTARKQLPAQTSVRALLDQRNNFGGLLMAVENVELGGWRDRISGINLPGFRWRGARAAGLLAASLAFLIVSLLLPLRFAAMNSVRALDVRHEVNDLAEKIAILKEEQILDRTKAEALEQKLDQLGKDAAGEDPVKTWEALDHLDDSVGKAAKEAAESASANLDKLDRAEALAEALMAAGDKPEMGKPEMVKPEMVKMDAKLLTESMQTMARMMQSAMQENRMLAGDISPELQEAIKSGALKPEQLKEIAKALGKNKSALNRKHSKLNRAGMIDAKSLKGGAQANRRDNSGLAQFLKENAERMSVEDAVEAWCENPGRGGVDRGRGDAAMTWTDGSSEKDAKFEEKVLPPSIAGLQESELIGVSSSAPTVENNVTAHGALNNSASGGGSAHTQTILPRHKGAVKRYFERK